MTTGTKDVVVVAADSESASSLMLVSKTRSMKLTLIPDKQDVGLEFVKKGWHLRVVRGRSFAAQLLDPLLNPLGWTNDLHARMLLTVA